MFRPLALLFALSFATPSWQPVEPTGTLDAVGEATVEVVEGLLSHAERLIAQGHDRRVMEALR